MVSFYVLFISVLFILFLSFPFFFYYFDITKTQITNKSPNSPRPSPSKAHPHPPLPPPTHRPTRTRTHPRNATSSALRVRHPRLRTTNLTNNTKLRSIARECLPFPIPRTLPRLRTLTASIPTPSMYFHLLLYLF